MKYIQKCARNAVILDEEISIYRLYVDIFKELYSDLHYHPIYSRYRLYTSDMIVAVEAANQEVPICEC